MRKISSQKGVAIILVLLIVALATSLAAFMVTQQNLWQRQVESQFDRTQARRIGVAAIHWARAVLSEDGRVNSYDHEKELWAMRLPAMPVDNGEVIGLIEDRQGLFNLNNLVRNGAASPADVAQFQHLLEILSLPAELATALVDWLDMDSETQYPGGAEDVYYLALDQPYRAANRPLAELSELSRVKGFDRRTIEMLSAYTTVLPTPGLINVNFAPPEVLAAVMENVTLPEARMIVLERAVQPFDSVASMQTRMIAKGVKVTPQDLTQLTVSSEYFMVNGRAKVGRAQVVTQALLHRVSGWPSVVWQSVQ
ncbi:MAG: type II secretion system minor pseudopilin GspK [Pseudomonadota bacterium]